MTEIVPRHLIVRVTGLGRFRWMACGKVVNGDRDKKTRVSQDRREVTCRKCVEKIVAGITSGIEGAE